jgi:hypothetical protein
MAKPPASDDNSNYSVYSDYNNALRAWFVVFGIGSIAALIASKELVDALRAARVLRSVVWLLALGAGAQIVLAFVNKTVAWTLYYAEENPPFKDTGRYGLAAWLSTRYVLDLCCDLGTMILFAIAFLRGLDAYVPL